MASFRCCIEKPCRCLVPAWSLQRNCAYHLVTLPHATMVSSPLSAKAAISEQIVSDNEHFCLFYQTKCNYQHQWYQSISSKGVWLQSANLVHVTETRRYIFVSCSLWRAADSSFSHVFLGFLKLCRAASCHDFGEWFVQTLKRGL